MRTGQPPRPPRASSSGDSRASPFVIRLATAASNAASSFGFSQTVAAIWVCGSVRSQILKLCRGAAGCRVRGRGDQGHGRRQQGGARRVQFSSDQLYSPNVEETIWASRSLMMSIACAHGHRRGAAALLPVGHMGSLCGAKPQKSRLLAGEAGGARCPTTPIKTIGGGWHEPRPGVDRRGVIGVYWWYMLRFRRPNWERVLGGEPVVHRDHHYAMPVAGRLTDSPNSPYRPCRKRSRRHEDACRQLASASMAPADRSVSGQQVHPEALLSCVRRSSAASVVSVGSSL